MRNLSVLCSGLVLCLSGALTACASQGADDDLSALDAARAAPAATKITISAPQPLALVAYREVADPVWHMATEETTGKFVAKVRGPYWVTAVCESEDTTFSDVWRMGRTLDDPHELMAPTCNGDAPVASPELTGSLTFPSTEDATVSLLGGATAALFTTQSGQASPTTYKVDVPKGTYTLYAFDSDGIVIHPGLAVKHSLAGPAIDLTTQIASYVPAGITATNADPAAFVHTATLIEPADGTAPVELVDLPAVGGEVVPNAAMTTDNQTVSVRADSFTFTGNVARSESLASRRPWRLGDDPTFTEPAQPTNPTWSFDALGQLVASWDALPPATFFCHSTTQTSATGAFAGDFTSMSGTFIAAVKPTSVVVDTSVPGFQPNWKVDYQSASYTRGLLEQDVIDLADPEHAPILTSEINDSVFPALAPAVAAPNTRAATPPALHRMIHER